MRYFIFSVCIVLTYICSFVIFDHTISYVQPVYNTTINGQLYKCNQASQVAFPGNCSAITGTETGSMKRADSPGYYLITSNNTKVRISNNLLELNKWGFL